MLSQRLESELARPRVVFTILLGTYLLVGSLSTVLACLITGVQQFGDLLVGPKPMRLRLGLLLELAVMFTYLRLFVGFLVSASLTWSIQRSLPAIYIAGFAIGIPVIAELCLARPWGSTWLGFLIAYVFSWPDVPQHLTSIGTYIRTGFAYMIPPLFSGLALALAAIRLRDRFLRT